MRVRCGSRKGVAVHMSSELLTVAEVARILRVDDTTVRRWVKQGALEAVVLPHVRLRQAYRIKRETLDKVLKESAVSNV
jgi:excisionase family DNA binding protein